MVSQTTEQGKQLPGRVGNRTEWMNSGIIDVFAESHFANDHHGIGVK